MVNAISTFRMCKTQRVKILVGMFVIWPQVCSLADAASDDWDPIPVRFFQVSDDDGKRQSAANIDTLRRQVDFMTQAFAPAQVRFTFDATRDFMPLRSTIVNNMVGTEDANWAQAKLEADRIAAGNCGKLVVFIRHGPGPRPAGGSFSWFDYNFITFATVDRIYWSLAHEAAHYFGLSHPHGGEEYQTRDEAEAFFVKNGKHPEIFDGDGLKDTPPCPAIKDLYETGDRSVTLAGFHFTILPGNVVSYYHHHKLEDDLTAGTMTPHQVRRLRWFVEMRVKHGMAMPSNVLIEHPIAATSLTVLKTDNCNVSPQPMDDFFKASWSSQEQLYGNGGVGGGVTLKVPVARPGKHQLVVALTQASDYGRLRFSLDSHTLSQEFNGYAPSVIPSGPINLGNFDLKPGPHRFTVRITGQDPLSTGHAFGLDCLQLTANPKTK